MDFSIAPLDTSLAPTLQHKIDNKTKPLGSLGRLETLALQIGLIQQDLYPVLRQPQMLIFAGDHGAAVEGVSLYPQAVTQQMVLNFVQGGAAINAFCAQNGLGLTIIDAGVNADFAADMPLVHAKIAKGTANYCSAAAMSAEQFEEALAAGAAVVEQKFQAGCNCAGLGEMGIGNTASASLIAHQLTGLPLTELVGRGTGLDDAGLAHKTATLQRALDFHALTAPDPAAVLRTFGGFEIVMLVGALLRAAERQMLVLVDGFIATAAALAAVKMHSNALAYCVFCHASFELGHKTLLRYLGAEPLLQLDMRLGEGSGAALAYPLVAAAVTFLNSMASFDNAGVSRAI